MKSPAFQFYSSDWLSSQRVSLMTLEEEGAYIRLLSYCWQHGSIPSNPEQIARLIGKGASTTLATTLSTMFQPHPENAGLMVHDRLEGEREKQRVWRQKSAAGGKKSAELRKNTHSEPTVVEPPLQGCLPNGTNQKATLQSSVFCLQTSDINTAAKAASGEKKPRERNELLDALVSADGSDPLQVTPPTWSQAAKALSQIKAVKPDVTAEEIQRRAKNYRTHMPDAAISSSALSKHWALCNEPKKFGPAPAPAARFHISS